MKKVFFLSAVLLAACFAETKTLSKEYLDGVIRDVTIPYLEKDKRVNSKEVESFLILSVAPSSNEESYDVDVSISEFNCDITFKFNLRSNDSTNVKQWLIVERSYERIWEKRFLLDYRGRCKLFNLDSNSVDFLRWKDPAGESVKKMFLDLLNKKFQIDQKDLQGFRIKNKELYQKYALLSDKERALICIGRLLSIEAREIKELNISGKKTHKKYVATFFVYKNYDGVWSSDYIDLKTESESFF